MRLESVADSQFPCNYISGDVVLGKSKTADQPPSTGTLHARPNRVWHVDTVGPTKTVSVHGYRYNTSFTCGFFGYILSYGHAAPSQFRDLQQKWFADIAELNFMEIHVNLMEIHWYACCVWIMHRSMFRVDENFSSLHCIGSEHICPLAGEIHHLGQAERMNGTLFSGARTALFASGLERRWWHHAVMFQTALQNITPLHRLAVPRSAARTESYSITLCWEQYTAGDAGVARSEASAGMGDSIDNV